MLTVKIELWPRGRQVGAKEIGRMYIANDGTTSIADPRFGDYRVAVCKRGTTDVPREVFDLDDPGHALHVEEQRSPKATRSARVRGYPRLAYNVWRLIARAVLGAFPEELNTRKGRGESVLDAEVMRGLAYMREVYANKRTELPQGEDAHAVTAAIMWLDEAKEIHDIAAAREACGLETT